MKEKKFYKLVNRRFDKILQGLTSKGKEYSKEDNKLHNFDRAALKRNISREEAIQGFMLKHEVSVDDIIENIKKGIIPKREVIDEKIGDLINYWILMEASIVQRIEEENEHQRSKD